MISKQRRLKIHHGKRLEQLMQSMHISVTELYRRTNISRNTITNKLQSETIEDKYIFAFSEALGIEPAYFAGTDDPDSYAAISLTVAQGRITALEKDKTNLQAEIDLLRNQLSINARYIDQLEGQLATRVSTVSEKDEKGIKKLT
jgi:transcriptional regulator with XRE-family HTH domain